jgi:hypothetical protein
MTCRSRLALAVLGALSAALVCVAPARADGPPAVDVPQEKPDESRAIDRTWLYADDARVAAPLAFIGMSSFSYTDVGSSLSRVGSPYPGAYRAFAANTAQPGAMASAGGELGLVPRVSVLALGQMALGGEGASLNAGAIAGLRFQLLPSAWANTHLVASFGYLREAWSGPVFNGDTGTWFPGSPHGSDGAWAQAAFAGDVGRLRLATTVHGEHVFSTGRDGVDLMVQAGASYRLFGAFRAGVEYVGQDLEEAFADGAEGGARHFVGPVASMQLLNDRLSIVAGPSVGLSQWSPAFVGRAAVAYGF